MLNRFSVSNKTAFKSHVRVSLRSPDSERFVVSKRISEVPKLQHSSRSSSDYLPCVVSSPLSSVCMKNSLV